MKRRFKQVDVFGAMPFAGNPVAVVLDGEGLSEAEMTSIARWTHLSETTFVLPPGYGGDYALRIFSPQGELPFAGHPTLGSAHAIVEASGGMGRLVQECGVGMVPVVVSGADDLGRTVSLEAPSALAAELAPSAVREVLRALGMPATYTSDVRVWDVGPRWCVLDLGDDRTVSRLAPDMNLLGEVSRTLNLTGVTVFGRCGGSPPLLRVRSFAPATGVPEDPACGSGNICVAAYLAQTACLHEIGPSYTAVQGQEIGRDARLQISASTDGSRIDLAGRTVTLIDGVMEA